MARSDLLIQMVRAGLKNDNTLMRQTVEAVIAEERSKQHHVLAEQLSETLRISPTNGNHRPVSILSDNRVPNLYLEIAPKKSLCDLFLPNHVSTACSELIEEYHRAELLRSYSIEPRNRVLLAGPPGTGKTSLAEALAQELSMPLIVLRYEGVIGSYLGETAQRLGRVFDFVRTRPCVFFLDEFDTLGKERGNEQETGEIKRVVSSLLLQIDALPSYVLVVTATNHPELLDRAVWRRFQLRLQLELPKEQQIVEWFQRFEERHKISLGVSCKALSKNFTGISYAELEDFTSDVFRRHVLQLPQSNWKEIVEQRLLQWKHRFKVNSRPAKKKATSVETRKNGRAPTAVTTKTGKRDSSKGSARRRVPKQAKY